MIDVAALALCAALGVVLGACTVLVWLGRPCPRCALLDATPLAAPVSFVFDDPTPASRPPIPDRAYRRTLVDLRTPDDD